MDRKRTTYLLLGGAAALFAWALIAGPHRPPATRPVISQTVVNQTQPLVPDGSRPQVDVVFALDTTGSMSGLLEGAKKKIWELARFIAQGQPTPQLRIGLIAYRDIGDEYVTKFFDLTDDLDAVYQNLSSLSAAGGGDTPEHVAKALHEAVYKTSWSSSKNALRIIYLVGDAPPHTDYQDGFNYHAIAQQAGERGIRINTIRCGQDADTQVAWQEIAKRAKGEYGSIDQSGGVLDTNTPFDEELAALNRRLVGTALEYGSAEKQAAARTRAEGALAAPKAAQAERAGLFGLFKTHGKAAAMGSDDLLEDVASNKADLNALAPAALPAPMKAMSLEQRKQFVTDKGKERSEVLDEINAVSVRRDAYLKKAKGAAPADSFDGKVRDSLKKQAADVGLKF